MAGNVELGLSELERSLLAAARSALNYISNIESEFGTALSIGDDLRTVIRKAESYTFICCRGAAPAALCGCERQRLAALASQESQPK